MRFSIDRRRLCQWLFCLTISSQYLAAASIHGTVLDPSDAAIAGARISALSPVGVIAQTTTNASGAFDLNLGESRAEKLLITAAGFATTSIPVDVSKPVAVRLELAAQVDTIRVIGSTMDVAATEQGSSVSIIPREEIAQRNEAQAIDLMRYLPGVTVAQSGQRGAVASIFIRGGESNFNLVQIDGIPVNRFGFSGFDFAHIPTDWLERIEVIRGPQSAVYGSYANSGAINFVTRAGDESPNLDILAEGGSHGERRFAVGGSGMAGRNRLALFASRLDADGPVVNSDYRNENLYAKFGRSMGRQDLTISANFNSNETGAPGPYGSNPRGLFRGIDRISRNKDNFSDYLLRYQIDISSRVRQELFGTFFLNNSFFQSPFGGSFNKDWRTLGETRTVVSVRPSYTMAAGLAFTREQVENTFITDNSFRQFPLHRDQEGLYWENRFQFGGRWFWNAGLRAEIIQTQRIPAGFGRPELAANTVVKVNPKVTGAWVLRGTRLHASFGTGIRPPSGLDLAFTNNPRLKPERTTSFDFGLEQKFFRNRVSLDETYFYNRFQDLIVSLGGSLAQLSSFQTDNLSNSRSQGVEISAQVRPARWISAGANYTFLDTKILALNGSSNLAPAFFRVGQQLLRRPRHSGAIVSSFIYKRFSANVTAYFRGVTLDVEPNFGASRGLFLNPGFQDLGINLNYRVTRGLSVYGNLRNALNQAYEEIYGFPSPKLNFVTGVKWSLSQAR